VQRQHRWGAEANGLANLGRRLAGLSQEYGLVTGVILLACHVHIVQIYSLFVNIFIVN